MPFWTRRRSCFLLCRSSVLSGVWLFRMRCRGAAFSASPGSAAPCFLSMYWGSFLLLRGFQRCRSGPAAGTFFLLCLSSDLSGVWLFRMHCRGAAFSASPGSAAPCVLSMYWGSFLLLRGFQRCRSGPAAGTKGTSWSRDVTPPLRDVKKTDIFGRLKCLLPCVKCLKAHDKWRQCGTLPLACPLELGTRNTDPGNSSSKLASGWPILNKPRTESMIMSIAGPFAVWPPCPSRQILMVS